MSNLLESILRVGMTVFIVGPLTAWVARRGARERSEATESLDRFTVRMPAAIRTIIACSLSRSSCSCWVFTSGRAFRWASGTTSLCGSATPCTCGHGHLGLAEHPASRRGR